MDIKCFIFSWKGQYENAVKLENQFREIGLVPTVINSDDDNTNPGWVNIGNDCYFSDQFRKALELFVDSGSEFMWHVQADASFDDWKLVLDSAKSSYEKYSWGIFAPNVDDTFYIPERTDVFDLSEKLKVVATTDNTCWIIRRDVIDNLISEISLMQDNKLGWGWDLLLCGFAHMNAKKVIRDYSFTVNHPKSTGYMKEQAEKEMFDMFNKCPEELKKIIYYIKQIPPKICEYYEDAPTDFIIYDTEAGR